MQTVSLDELDRAYLHDHFPWGSSQQDSRVRGAIEAVLPPEPPPPAVGPLRLHADDQGQVTVLQAPAGTDTLHIAWCVAESSGAVIYSQPVEAGKPAPAHPDLAYPLSAPIPWISGYPWIGAEPKGKGSSLGPWTARILSGAEAPPPAPPPASGTGLVIALDTSGWGGGIHKDLAGKGIVKRRINNPSLINEITAAGAKVVTVCFKSGDPLGQNPATYSSELAALAKTYPQVDRWEVLNEPEMKGKSEAQIKRYVELLKACHEAFAKGGVKAKLIASWAPTYGYGVAWAKAGGLPYVDEVVCHAYGGSNHQHGGLLGGRDIIEQSHRESGKPVAVTEIGWPTGRSAGHTEPTGDSEQWTEAQQAQAITDFAKWCLTQTYVTMFVYFNGVDYEEGSRYMWYGVKRKDLSDKPSVKTLAEACKLAGVAA